MTDLINSPLGDLAERVKAEHDGVKAAARMALDHALDAGDALIEAKQWVPHGGWGDWLRSTGINDRTAQLYMKLARNRDRLKTATVADLTIRQAAKILAEPKGDRLKQSHNGCDEAEILKQQLALMAAYAQLPPIYQKALVLYVRKHGTSVPLDPAEIMRLPLFPSEEAKELAELWEDASPKERAFTRSMVKAWADGQPGILN